MLKHADGYYPVKPLCYAPVIKKLKAYSVVKAEGNPRAVAALDEVFGPDDAYWRGIGELPLSGLKLREPYAHMEATGEGGLVNMSDVPDYPEPKGCSCGDVLKGMKVPTDCPPGPANSQK